jgi:hypothetical protein
MGKLKKSILAVALLVVAYVGYQAFNFYKEVKEIEKIIETRFEAINQGDFDSLFSLYDDYSNKRWLEINKITIEEAKEIFVNDAQFNQNEGNIKSFRDLSIQIKKKKATAYFERVLIYHGEEDDDKDKFIQLVQLVNTNEEWKIVDDTVTLRKIT